MFCESFSDDVSLFMKALTDFTAMLIDVVPTVTLKVFSTTASGGLIKLSMGLQMLTPQPTMSVLLPEKSII